ncbi:porin family protein [Novosphingobium sp. PS1R-30]|uniref:Porin family protein n=1 Tax=Novosphingobium anseongense TaxID=3133436 RepID=A0ABU8RZL3_9SPHN|nr:MAG: porin family protein [Novosphingobium sp.]
MRKVLLSLAAAGAVAASPAFAAAEPGPYVGVGVTHDNVSGTQDAEGLGFNGIGGTVFAGYNIPLGEKAFAGVEANFDLSSAKVEDATSSIKARNAYGASARLGYRLSEGAALYGRVGYQRGSLKFNDGLATEFKSSRDGLRLGAGLEANVAGNTAVRVEYNHTNYYRDKDVDPVNTGLANNQATVGLVVGF